MDTRTNPHPPALASLFRAAGRHPDGRHMCRALSAIVSAAVRDYDEACEPDAHPDFMEAAMRNCADAAAIVARDSGRLRARRQHRAWGVSAAPRPVEATAFTARVFELTGVCLSEMPDLPADAHLVPGPIVARRGGTAVYAITDYPVGDGELEVLGYVVGGRTDDLPAARVCPEVNCMVKVTVATCETCTDRRLRGLDHEDDAQADCDPGERWAIRTDILRGEHAAALSRWERLRGEEDGRREQVALAALLAAEEAEDDGRAAATPPADLRYAGHMTPAAAARFGVEPGVLVHYVRSQTDVEPWTRDIWIAETGEHIGCSAMIGDAIRPAA